MIESVTASVMWDENYGYNSDAGDFCDLMFAPRVGDILYLDGCDSLNDEVAEQFGYCVGNGVIVTNIFVSLTSCGRPSHYHVRVIELYPDINEPVTTFNELCTNMIGIDKNTLRNFLKYKSYRYENNHK